MAASSAVTAIDSGRIEEAVSATTNRPRKIPPMTGGILFLESFPVYSSLMPVFSDIVVLIKTVGYLGFFIIVFAESGLFVGFFLPGDSLLFTAGFLASQNYLNIWALLGLAIVGAVAGDSIGYAFGRRAGPKIFTRENSLLFNKKYVQKAEEFYEIHGSKTIVLARFTPVIRTFAPIVAGVGKMNYATFLFYNVVGGILWGAGLLLAGFFLGASIPNVDRYLLPIVAGIIVLSILPGLIHFLREYRKS